MVTIEERPGEQIAVFGVGRIGAVTAIGLAHLGHDVVGVDPSSERIASLSRGHLPESEPGLRSALEGARRFRRLRLTSSLESSTAILAFICVDTPALASGDADLRQVFNAAMMAASGLAKGGVLVTRSTVPVGTGDRLVDQLRELGREDIEVVHMPEFLREGRAWEDFLEADRLVLGGESADALALVERVFSQLARPVFCTDRRTAELAKYAANAFLATSVSFANEMSDLAGAIDADAPAVFAILRADARIGPQAYLTPGLGYGGHCLPKDMLALEQLAAAKRRSLLQLRATQVVNSMRPYKVASWLRGALGTLSSTTVCIAGLTFKADTDDLRQSPPLNLAKLLTQSGVHVTGWDSNARSPAEGVDIRPSMESAVDGADALVIGHAWEGWKRLDPIRIGQAMHTRAAYDAPGILDANRWAEAGFRLNRRSRPRQATTAADREYS